jgi:HlyD family secretion protein
VKDTRLGDGWGAFVVEAGRAVEKRVKPGHRAGAFVEVAEGLGAGDVVVLYPGERVTDGMRVAPRAPPVQ